MARRRRRREIFRARVVELAKGGDGIAHAEAGTRQRPLFVSRAVPGDLLDVRITEGDRADIVSIIQPSPVRVLPPCPHAQACGGCDWMHIAVEQQQRARKRIVEQALTRAKLEVQTITAHEAPKRLEYRVRGRLAVQARKTATTVGFRAPRSHRLVPIDSCRILHPDLQPLLPEIGSWLDGSDGRGEATVTRGRGALPVVCLAWQGELASSVFATAQQHVQDGHWAGVSILVKGAKEPANIGDPRGVTVAVDGEPLVFPPGGFIQAFDDMNHQLVRHVVDASEVEHRPTLELFSGSGNFSVALARHTEMLETVEHSPEAVDAARENLDRRSLIAKLRVGDADTTQIRSAVRVAVLDPPRTGARGAAERLCRSKVRRVVMVSCDPATLARDAATLHRDGRFELQRVDIFEMFPHTSHVEIVAVLEKHSSKNTARKDS